MPSRLLRSSRSLASFRAALLASAAIFAASPGFGQSFDGVTNPIGPGGNGTPYVVVPPGGGGGGGGAGTTGGSGTAGNSPQWFTYNGDGGAGGFFVGLPGQDGGDGHLGGAGGGGGGGAHAYFGTGAPGFAAVGGFGGDGGEGGEFNTDLEAVAGGGGGAGAGGYGAVIEAQSNPTPIVVQFVIRGGDGGNGGSGASFTWNGGDFPEILRGGAGNGGTGGTGVYLLGVAGQVNIQANVSGGDGGMGGNGLLPTVGGLGGNGLELAGSEASVLIAAGAVMTGGDGGTSLSGPGTGGVGGYGILISGDNNVLTLAGGATGGLQGANPSNQSAAISITGNGNSLVLAPTSTTNGGVVASGWGNALALGGYTGATFDVSQIGSEFSGFAYYVVTDNGSWTLVNESYDALSWGIGPGTLSIAQAGSLGGAGSQLTVLNSGELQTTASLMLDQTIGLNGGTGPGATFNVASGTVLTLSGSIVNPGNLIVTGGGTLVLAGNNSFGGTTTVAQGTLSLASPSPLGSGLLALSNGTTLDFASTGISIGSPVGLTGAVTVTVASGSSGTLAGNVGDLGSSGGFTLAGPGSLVLEGNNSFTGPVTIAAGTLIAGSATALGGNAAITLQAGGTLTLQASVAAGSLAGTGAVALGANALTVGADNTSTTFAGSFSGTGGLTKTGLGVFTLSDVDADFGALTITGGTVVLNAGTVLGSSTVVGFSGGASSELQLNSSQAIAGLTGDGSLQLGSAQLTVDMDGGPSTFSGGINGAGGSLVKAGSGALTLAGTNTYTGQTSIIGGTLALAGGAAIADSSAVTMSGGAQLVLMASEVVGSLAGTGTLTLGGNTLTLGGNGASTNFSGSASGGSLVKQGGGTAIFTGSYDLASLTISGGVAQIGDGTTATSFQGAIIDNGALVLTPAQELVLAGAISGTGSVTVNAFNAPVTLTAANSYTGGTTIASGTLNLGSGTTAGSLVGPVVNNGTLAFNSSQTQSFAGLVSGTGGVALTGGGMVTLSGANTYAGGTLVANGSTLAVGSDGNLGTPAGAVTLANGTLAATASFTSARAVLLRGPGGVDVAAGATLTLSGTISETAPAQLTKSGSGVLALTGTNRYSGGTLVSAGTLAVGSDANLGAAIGGVTLNGGTLAATASFSSERSITLGAAGGTFDVGVGNTLTLAGAIGGSGSLAKAGAGTLALSGASTYTGATAVSGGTLALYGASLATGSVSIENGGTLEGFGAISGTVSVLAGGTLAGGVTDQPNPTHSALATGALSIAGAADVALTLGDAGNTGVAEAQGNLALGGTLSVSGEAIHGAGLYRVFTYTGTSSGSFATVDLSGLVDSASYIGSIDSGNPGQVNLLLRDSSPIQLWTTDNGTSFGGSGTWSSTGDNWYLASTGSTIPWGGQVGIFTGTAGTITVSGEQTFQKLEFVTDGFHLEADAGDPDSRLHVSGGGVLWVEGHDVTATISAPIGGTGGLEKIGTGTLVLSGINSYVGGTKVSGGFLSVANAAALGDAGNVLTLSGGGLETTGSFTLGSAVVLDGFGSLKPASGETLGLSGIVSGTGTLRKEGLGTLVLSGANTYSGMTVIAEGTLETQSGAAIPDASAVRIEAAGNLRLDANEGIGSLSGSGAVNLQGHTLRVGYDASSSVFSGTISGTGGLVKLGAGALVLAGTNNYSGGTLIAEGGLVIGNGGTSGSIVGDVVNQGTLSFYRSDTLAFAGRISGSGAVAQIGTGTLILSGANSYSGGTLISHGTIQVGAEANLGQVSGAVLIEAGTLSTMASFSTPRAIMLAGGGTIGVATGTTLELTTPVSGDGGLTKSGDGTLILAADNSYGGVTTIRSGVLQLGNGGTTGSVGGPIVNDATLAFNRHDSFAVSNNVSGSGTVVQAGTGTLVVLGDIHTLGGLRIDQGTVQIGNGGTSGMVSGPVVDNGTLVFARADSVTFAHAISGSGRVVQLGGGELTLTGTNSYAGGTVIGSGSAIRVAADAALGAAAGAVTLLDGTLFVDQSFASTRTVALSGGGTIGVADAAIFTLSGGVSGDGGLRKSGNGTLVLGGDNSYGGGTVIEGGTLQVGAGGTSGSITGDVSTAGTLRFDRSDDIRFAGAISGSGSLIQAGSGTLVLTGASSFTGGTRVTAGTLMLGDGGSSGSILGNVTDNGTLAFNRSDAVSFNGIISGSGGVVQMGTGTLTLAGANTYAGGTVIGAGSTLQVASDGNLGAATGSVTLAGGTFTPTASFASARAVSLQGSGSFDLASGIALTLSGPISGDGALVLGGGGTLALTGVSSYSGGTFVTGSTLAAASDASLGQSSGVLSLNGATLNVLHSFAAAREVTLGAAGGVFEVPTGLFLTLSGTVDGPGMLTKSGAGLLTLTGTNGYAGLAINAGTVVGTSASVQGDVLNNGALVFAQSSTGTFAGTIAGSGSLTVEGAGSLILTGTAAHMGGTTIDGGTLQIGNGGTSGWVYGSIVNEGTLIYDLSGRYIFPAALTGMGEVMLQGGGTVDFTGTSYTGIIHMTDTHVVLARGVVTDASFSVGQGSVLSGAGSIGSLDVLSGGIVAPGYSPGTLQVSGNAYFGAGSVYRVDLSPGRGSDLILADGSVSISYGSAIEVKAERGSYASYSSFTVITGMDGVHGVFDSVTTNFAFLDALPSYDGNNVVLNLVRNDTPFWREAHTPNQISTAIGTETLGAGNEVYDAVASQLTSEAFAAFDALSGEIYATTAAVIQQQSVLTRDAVSSRLRQVFGEAGGTPLAYAADGPQVAGFGSDIAAVMWMQGFGAWGDIGSNGNAAAVSDSIGGVIGGFDAAFGEDWRFGAYGGYSRSWLDVADRGSSGSMDNYDLGLYGAAQYGAIALRLGAGYAWHDVSISRTVAFAGYAGSNSSDSMAGSTQLFGELGYDMPVGDIDLEPFVGLAYLHFDGGLAVETGSSSALAADGGTMDTLYSTLGLRGGKAITVNGLALTTSFTLGWQHAFGDTMPEAVMTFATGSAPFAIEGTPIATDTFIVGAGLSYDLNAIARLSVRYDGQLASGAQQNAVTGQLQIRF
ncbi:autotransporter-associated beta strand repeat-containing protein [Ancylobacter sp. VNQ12]|uniref:autotransporter-associated beta strand repeat-containing protein n=1 Tax=Ancylobacter sp. VNQ12 TaxID=3400920 RepID=UPI003BFDB1E1